MGFLVRFAAWVFNWDSDQKSLVYSISQADGGSNRHTQVSLHIWKHAWVLAMT
jgi:hypothetical protein